jgi:hypothetical protein
VNVPEAYRPRGAGPSPAQRAAAVDQLRAMIAVQQERLAAQVGNTTYRERLDEGGPP